MLDFVYYPVSAVLWVWHTGFAAVFGPASGLSWALAIVFLVVTLRLMLYRPFLAQVRFARTMAELQPKARELREKFAGDREALARGMRELQREHKFNIFTGFLPIIGQLLIFLGLLHVLRSFDHTGGNYVFPAAQVRSFLQADVLGAPLSATLAQSGGALVSVALLIIPLVLTSAIATHCTARAAVARQTEVTPQIRLVNRMSMWLLPVASLLAGLVMPVGILIYFATTSAWTFLQQHYVHRRLEPVGAVPEL
ncbi:membrane protein insertase YidC [Nocardia sp. NPDC051570]|uniref:membrane protein insertase YidC n=1 Tax=Nocardia sp. NPDC051570 TaxID=3364324 RepID=UPI0037AC7BBC